MVLFSVMAVVSPLMRSLTVVGDSCGVTCGLAGLMGASDWR